MASAYAKEGWHGYYATKISAKGVELVRDGKTRENSAVIKRLRLQGWDVVAVNHKGSNV